MSYWDISQWYTDSMDVFRTVNSSDGNLTVQSREQVGFSIPCRVYAPDKSSPTMTDRASYGRGSEKVACGLTADIREGDELLITRGGALGHHNTPERFFAGHPVKYYDPVGGAMTFIQHQEIGLIADNIIGEGV